MGHIARLWLLLFWVWTAAVHPVAPALDDPSATVAPVVGKIDGRVIVICGMRWAVAVFHGLGCVPQSVALSIYGDYHKDHFHPGADLVSVIDHLKRCEEDVDTILVPNRFFTKNVRQVLAQEQERQSQRKDASPNETVRPDTLLIGIGRHVASSIGSIQKGKGGFDVFRKVVLLRLKPEEGSGAGGLRFRFRLREDQCLEGMECHWFDIAPAIFLAGVSAALPPFTKRTVGILSDRRIEGEDVENELTVKAFTSGVKYVDRDVEVVVARVLWRGRFAMEPFKEALVTELRQMLEEVSLVYLDIFGDRAITAVLEAMAQKQVVVVGESQWAILPPWFAAFDAQGAPREKWQQVIFNTVSVDMARAVHSISRGDSIPRILHMKDGYVTTFWTNVTDSNSRWVSSFVGDSDKMDPHVQDLMRLPCGKANDSNSSSATIDISDRIVSIRQRLIAEDQSQWKSTCKVHTQICNIPPEIGLKGAGGIPNSWPRMDCVSPDDARYDLPSGSLEIEQEEECAGAIAEPTRCSLGEEEKLFRRIGVGLEVNNLADIDTHRGIYYIDFDLYMFEDNQRYTEKDLDRLLETPECSFGGGLMNPMKLGSLGNFLDRFSFVGVDRFITITPGTDGHTSFVNFKGNIFFKPDLASWPFDRQSLVVEMGPAIASFEDGHGKFKFCVMHNFTAISPMVRLAGVSDEGPWKEERLNMSHKLAYSCRPPYQNPTGAGCGRTPPAEADGDDASCWCMKGKRRAHKVKFFINFKRPTNRMLISVFLPPLAIMILNQAVLFLHIEASETRLLMCSSALLSSVMYHITINSNTPPTATDFTMADSFMILCYGQNILIWLVVLLMYIFDKSQKDRLGRWARASLFGKCRATLPVMTALFIYLISSKPEGSSIQLVVNLYVLVLCCLVVGASIDYLRFESRRGRTASSYAVGVEMAALEPRRPSDVGVSSVA